MKYEHVLRSMLQSPWAITADMLALILTIVGDRQQGQRLSDDEIEARIEAARQQNGPRRGRRAQGNVEILPIYGPIMPRANMMTAISGGTSIDGFKAQFDKLLQDPEVGTIVLDVDSPGGYTDGVPELASYIREARGQKPIVAVANYMAASAAYWLASQADELIVTPSGQVGSVGIYGVHEDHSAEMETRGVKTTLISAGKFKTEGNPFEPLSDEARAKMQADVNAMYDVFIGDVAKGRGVTPSAVRSDYGEGRLLFARDALAAGMVDRIDTLDATVQRLTRGGYVRVSAPRQTQQIDAGDESATNVSEPIAAEATLGTGPFSRRLSLVTEEASVLVGIARARAERRQPRQLSSESRDELTALRASLSSLVEEIDASLVEPSQTVAATNVSARLRLAEARQKGYRI